MLARPDRRERAWDAALLLVWAAVGFGLLLSRESQLFWNYDGSYMFSLLTRQHAWAIPLDSLSIDFYQGLGDSFIPANFRLLHRLDPLLRKSPAGRALFVTSGVAWKRHAGWAPYSVSKAGLEALVGVYAHEIEGTAVRANLISPGPIRTELRTEAWPEEDPGSVPLPEALGPAIVTLLSPACDRNGVIFDFKSGRYTRCQAPA